MNNKIKELEIKLEQLYQLVVFKNGTTDKDVRKHITVGVLIGEINQLIETLGDNVYKINFKLEYVKLFRQLYIQFYPDREGRL